MTTEEKAKAYDEALERARKIHNEILNNEILGFPEQIREIFPELRESEDEMIRKELIEYLKAVSEQVGGLSYPKLDRWMAYLEKQGQETNIELVQKSWYMEGYHDREFGKEPMWLITACDDGPRYELNPKYGKKLAEEQKPELVQHPPITFTFNSNASRDERLKAALLALLNSDLLKVKEGGYFTKQDLIEWVERIPTDKPAEKQDYSDLTDLERAIHRGFLSAGVENVPVTIIKETAWECLAHMNPAEWNDTDMKEERNNLISVCRDWECGKQTTLLPIAAIRARYFLEHLTEPKPAEWSEEDKTRLTNILIMLQEYVIHHYSKDDVNKSVDWLKALPGRFNLQPKPEWSEADEDRIRQIERIAQQAGCTQKLQEEIHDWLKDLRPSWKPSEEQMAALKWQVEHPELVKWRKGDLESLYEQLKKL